MKKKNSRWIIGNGIIRKGAGKYICTLTNTSCRESSTLVRNPIGSIKMQSSTKSVNSITPNDIFKRLSTETTK